MTIQIITKADSRIRQSLGGGVAEVHYEWATTPRNLVLAAKALAEHRKTMTASLGNVGCGHSWIEIDGQRIDECDLNMWEFGPSRDPEIRESRTECARQFLAHLAQ